MHKIIENFYRKLYSTSVPKPDRIVNEKRRIILNVDSEEIPEIDRSELRAALRKMKNRKAPGEDRVMSEMLKMGGEPLEEALLILLNKCLREQQIPTAWKNAEVILLFKKGASVENYRPISLLSTFYKLLTRIVAVRLTNKFDFYQPVEQVGFRRGYSTIDHLQVMHMLIEKAAEYNIPLHLAFIDYQKASDSIEIWAVLEAMEEGENRFSILQPYPTHIRQCNTSGQTGKRHGDGEDPG